MFLHNLKIILLLFSFSCNLIKQSLKCLKNNKNVLETVIGKVFLYYFLLLLFNYLYLFYFGLVPDLQVDTLWVLCREGLYSKLCTFLFYTFLLLGNPFRNNCNLDKCQWNIFHYLSRSRASNVVPIVSENLTNKDPEVQNLSRYSFMNVIFFFWLPQFCLFSSSLEFYWTFLILCKISNLLAIKIDWWKP